MIALRPTDAPGETTDGVGELRLLQHRRGYRFTLDAVLLAGFALERLQERPARHLVDLGAGCGVVGLLVARRGGAQRTTAVEIQPALAALTMRNAALNGLSVEVLEADLRHLGGRLGAQSADAVLSNPPYVPLGEGRPCGDPERNIARREDACTLLDVVRSAARLLRPDGFGAFVYPSPRLPALLEALAQTHLAPVRLRFVHPRANAGAHAVLVEARPGSRAALRVEPPLIVHAADGGWSDEVQRLLTSRDAAPS